MKKNKYDTGVIMLCLLGQEQLLPKEFRKKIPYSTISTWRKEKYENYQGSEFRSLFDDNWDLIRLKQENRKLKNTLRAIAKCNLFLKPELNGFVQQQKRTKDFQKKLVLAGVIIIAASTCYISTSGKIFKILFFNKWGTTIHLNEIIDNIQPEPINALETQIVLKVKSGRRKESVFRTAENQADVFINMV